MTATVQIDPRPRPQAKLRKARAMQLNGDGLTLWGLNVVNGCQPLNGLF
jgi:hypothetical protein